MGKLIIAKDIHITNENLYDYIRVNGEFHIYFYDPIDYPDDEPGEDEDPNGPDGDPGESYCPPIN